MKKITLLVMMLILVPSVLYAQNLKQWDHKLGPGPVYHTFVSSDTVVIHTSSRVEIFNTSSSSYILQDFRHIPKIWDVALKGKTLFVAFTDSVGLFDITDVNNITKTSNITCISDQIEVFGDTLYIRSGNNAIEVYDVSNTSIPVFKQQVPLSSLYSFRVSNGTAGDTLWTVAGDSIYILDLINNYTAIDTIASLGHPGVTSFNQLFKADSVLFVGANDGVHRVSVLDPLNPEVSASYQPGHRYDHLFWVDDTLYITDEWGDDHIFDQLIAPLNTPSITLYQSHSLAANAWITDITAVGDSLYLPAYGEGWYIYDISDQSSISQSYHGQTGFAVNYFAVNDKYVFATQSFSGIKVFGYSDSLLNTPVVTYVPSPVRNYGAVYVQNNYIYVAYTDAFEVFDISGLPGSIVPVNTISGIGNAAGMAGNDTALFVSSNSGFRVFNIKDPLNIVQLHYQTAAGNVKDMWLGEKVLYTTKSGSGLEFYDISSLNVMPPAIGGGYSNAGARRVTVDEKNDLAYVALLNGSAPDSIKVINISNISSPVEINTFRPSDSVNFFWDLNVYDHYLAAAMDDGGVFIFNVSDPYNVSEIAKAPTYGNAFQIKSYGFFLFQSDQSEGLNMFKYPYGAVELKSDKFASYFDEDSIRLNLTLMNELKAVYCDTNVFSFEYKVRFDTALLDTIANTSGNAALDTVGSLLDNAGFTVFASLSDDTLIVAGAGSMPVDVGVWSGPQKFITALFKKKAAAATDDTVHFRYESFVLNDGYPQARVKNGQLKLKPRFGDVSGNQSITALDASLVIQHNVKLATLTGDSLKRAEVSGNGKITSFDASYILRYSAGLVYEFPADINYLQKPLPAGFGETKVDYDKNYDEDSGIVTVNTFLKDMKNILAAEIELEHPGMKFSEYSIDKNLGGFISEAFDENGILRFAMAGVSPAGGENSVISFKFRADDINAADRISFNRISLNEAEYDLANLSGDNNLPEVFRLYQNYPNPFNPVTTIKYDLPQSGEVIMKIYNVLGQEVKTLVNTGKIAGYHKLLWNGTNNVNRPVASGVYFYRIEYKYGKNASKSHIDTRKLLLIR